MKRILALALTVFLACPVFANDAHRAVIERIHKYTHSISQRTITDADACSATAIGPHALLTASHCELPTNDLDVDGTETKIIKILRDQNDHSIFITNGNYKDFAALSSDPAKVGDTVFIFGNPGKHNDIFRQGTVVAVEKEIPDSPFSDRVPPVTVCDLNSFSGDSGAAIFDETGGNRGRSQYCGYSEKSA